MTKPFTCKVGLHDYIGSGTEKLTDPPRGPFDPRTESDRTYTQEMEVCAACGKKRKYDFGDYPRVYELH